MRSLREIKRKIMKRIVLPISDSVKIRKIDEIDIVPTLKCNLNCIMCHQKEIKCKQDMHLSGFRSLINNLKKSGISKVSLVGGEIFIYQGIWEMIDILEKNKLYFDLATNAVALNDTWIARLKNLKYLEKITTSLDGNQRSIIKYVEIRLRIKKQLKI